MAYPPHPSCDHCNIWQGVQIRALPIMRFPLIYSNILLSTLTVLQETSFHTHTKLDERQKTNSKLNGRKQFICISFINAVLICYYYSQIPELHHIFKGPIMFFVLQPGEETTYTSFSSFIHGPSYLVYNFSL
jgi:hypothetical protein